MVPRLCYDDDDDDHDYGDDEMMMIRKGACCAPCLKTEWTSGCVNDENDHGNSRKKVIHLKEAKN